MTTAIETALAALLTSLRQIPALADLDRNVDVEQIFTVLDAGGPNNDVLVVASLGDGQMDSRTDWLGTDGAEIIWRASLDVLALPGPGTEPAAANAGLAALANAVNQRLRADRTLTGAVAYARDEVARREPLREFGVPAMRAMAIDIVMTILAPHGQ